MPRLTEHDVVAPGGVMVPRLFRLVERRQDTADTFTMMLEPTDAVPLKFIAGQFTMLSAFGVGEVPISVSGAANVDGPLQHTVRDVGPVTHALSRTAVGAVVGIRGPYGTGWNVGEGADHDVVLVAGGIGLAPLRPAMLEVLQHRQRYGRVVLLYGTRSPEDRVFADELKRWENLGVEVMVTVTFTCVPNVVLPENRAGSRPTVSGVPQVYAIPVIDGPAGLPPFFRVQPVNGAVCGVYPG